MRPVHLVLLVLTNFLFMDSASATLDRISARRVDNSPGGTPLVGFVTNDMSLDFSIGYAGSSMILELTSGSIYQDTFGAQHPPSPSVLSTFPALEFDTFVAHGITVQGSPFGEPRAIGGAVDIGGFSDRTIQFDTQRLNIAWSRTPAEPAPVNQTSFINSRITLSDNAFGTLQYYTLLTAINRPREFIEVFSNFKIINGHIVVPEPSCMTLLGFTLLVGGILPQKCHRFS